MAATNYSRLDVYPGNNIEYGGEVDSAPIEKQYAIQLFWEHDVDAGKIAVGNVIGSWFEQTVARPLTNGACGIKAVFMVPEDSDGYSVDFRLEGTSATASDGARPAGRGLYQAGFGFDPRECTRDIAATVTKDGETLDTLEFNDPTRAIDYLRATPETDITYGLAMAMADYMACVANFYKDAGLEVSERVADLDVDELLVWQAPVAKGACTGLRDTGYTFVHIGQKPFVRFYFTVSNAFRYYEFYINGEKVEAKHAGIEYVCQTDPIDNYDFGRELVWQAKSTFDGSVYEKRLAPIGYVISAATSADERTVDLGKAIHLYYLEAYKLLNQDYKDGDPIPGTKSSITPFFASLPWSTGQGYWNTIQYTQKTRASYISDTEAQDGWCTIVFDPQGANANIAAQVSPAAGIVLEEGDEYTLMVEFADFSTTPTGATFQIYANVNYDQLRPAGNETLTLDFAEGVQYVPMKVFTPTGTPRLMRVDVRRGSFSGSFTGKVRLSLYQGTYNGPYVPYKETA